MPEPVIEPIRRAFAVLQALNRRRSTTLAVLAAETGLPGPTVVRLLHTLIALGYASRVSREAGYRLTDQVLSLAGGVRFIDHLVDAAIPHMSRFTREQGWPLYLATLSAGGMAIRHSTAPESPMSFEAAGYDRKSPMSFEAAGYDRKSPVLVGALGRAWIAFCPDDERRRILRGLGVRQGPALKAALESIRRDGFAFTQPPRPMRMHGMAVAILDNDRVAGCISMRFPRSAMSEAEAGTRYGGLLATMTAAIAADLATRRDAG
jgi:IclR family transcriptional regulator, mhp operon transcriptional activator